MKFKAVLFSFLMAGLIFNACAKEIDTTDYKKDEISIIKKDEKKDIRKKENHKEISDEEKIQSINESIKNLNIRYQNNKIDEENYNAKLNNLNLALESINERINMNKIEISNLKNLKIGMNMVSATIDGQTRYFKVYKPSDLKEENTSLVFRFHGSGSTNSVDPAPFIKHITKSYSLNKVADNNNFIAIYPAAIVDDNNNCGWYQKSQDSDLKFFDLMVKSFLDNFSNVDENRIYVTGHSSGGIFSFELAGKRENIIAASVPVSGQYNLMDKKTNEIKDLDFLNNNISIPLRAYNGTLDSIVNYDAVKNNMNNWIEYQNKGSKDNYKENNTKIEDYNITIKSYEDGLSDIQLYTVHDEGHGISWDKIAPSIWEFMNSHPKK